MLRFVQVSRLFRTTTIFYRKAVFFSCKSRAEDVYLENPSIKAEQLPGGGLGKLQNPREEIYFRQQQHDLIQKLCLEKFGKPEKLNTLRESEELCNEGSRAGDISRCVYNTLKPKSLDAREEQFFYNERLDLIKRMRKIDSSNSPSALVNTGNKN